MSKTQDKKQIVETIIRAAKIYQNVFVGRTFLYVFEGRLIEVIYRRKEFLHLTGVDTPLSANEFFKEALRGTLRHTQIFFSNRHPYDLCIKKMQYLERITAVTDSAIVMLEDLTTQTFRYKFGLSELSFTLCLDADTDSSKNVVSRFYIARSLRAEDSFSRSSNVYEVHYIFSKPNDAPTYSTLSYMDSRMNLSQLPDAVVNMLDATLRDQV